MPLKAMAPKAVIDTKERLSQSHEKKCCHQCRQKTDNFGGACKTKRGINKKPCPLRYCERCLLNRYGEQEKVALREDRWTCPRCRGICNCSCCTKKRGEKPTGILIHAAKASGCASVHDLLVKGSEAVAAAQVDCSLKRQRIQKIANNFGHEGANLIALLPPVHAKKRTEVSYSEIKKRVPRPMAEDNLNALHTTKVTPNSSQVTSSAGAQAVKTTPAPQFLPFEVPIP